MAFFNGTTLRNRLLRALSADDFNVVAPSLELVNLPLRTSLAEPGVAIEHVYFIETGLASVVAVGPDGERIEVGHVGWEGMTGTPVGLSVDTSDTHTFMQVAGSATRIGAADFTTIVESRPAIRTLVLRYIYTQQVQVAYSALATARYGLRACLARWILMSHDRIGLDELPLTHEFLSLMLGVRRAGVTETIHVLEETGAVRASRGKIQIVDRPRLVEIAGASYGTAEAAYDRLIA